MADRTQLWNGTDTMFYPLATELKKIYGSVAIQIELGQVPLAAKLTAIANGRAVTFG